MVSKIRNASLASARLSPIPFSLFERKCWQKTAYNCQARKVFMEKVSSIHSFSPLMNFFFHQLHEYTFRT